MIHGRRHALTVDLSVSFDDCYRDYSHCNVGLGCGEISEAVSARPSFKDSLARDLWALFEFVSSSVGVANVYKISGLWD